VRAVRSPLWLIGPGTKMDFDEILEIEPGLRILKNEAIEFMANSPGAYWKRSRFWYRQLKPSFIQLVGFMAKRAELERPQIYDTAYAAFMEILKI